MENPDVPARRPKLRINTTDLDPTQNHDTPPPTPDSDKPYTSPISPFEMEAMGTQTGVSIFHGSKIVLRNTNSAKWLALQHRREHYASRNMKVMFPHLNGCSKWRVFWWLRLRRQRITMEAVLAALELLAAGMTRWSQRKNAARLREVF